MAFNFNWSPLIADTSRAREMLTTALNKSPKPPIIVDDIIVTELNLGSVAPELEILEIGDLAEDRFRGIFKMQYTGDAYLTLKTRVQANPLNTYLSTKPSFASPQPLAAASGLTIPVAITLSDIKLSGFVILVFSKQKGITLVFRNDPLESLKVSSTFDSIPFVRDYLQRTIEAQLRVLFMDDLPAIIHRLSLRLWSPEYQGTDSDMNTHAKADDNTIAIDPLASPPQEPRDGLVNSWDDDEFASFSLNTSTETHATFSQKNLLRLAALTDSHRTLSLFTPSIRDTVFRAWAGAAERGDHGSGYSSPFLTASSLSRVQSTITGSSPSTMSDSGETSGSLPSRPSLTSFSSTYGGLNLGAGRTRGHGAKKRKHRIINLRKDKSSSETSSVGTASSTPIPSAAPSVAPSSEEHAGDELTSPPRVRFQSSSATAQPIPMVAERPSRPSTPRFHTQIPNIDLSSPQPQYQASAPIVSTHPQRPTMQHSRSYTLSKAQTLATSAEKERDRKPIPGAATAQSHSEYDSSSSSSGGILEQAWMLKMANEVARKVAEERSRVVAAGGEFWDVVGHGEREEMPPPPAYAL